MRWILILLGALSASSFATTPIDPYPGSGGYFMGTPSEADIQSGRAIFTDEKCSGFSIGLTAKADVVAKLGPPAGWSSERDGTSLLEYDFVEASGMMGMRRVIAATFNFDHGMKLYKIACPGHDKEIPPADVVAFKYVCDTPVPKVPAGAKEPITLSSWYSKDRETVYAYKEPIRGADAASFKRACCGLCEVCGEDKNRCYWYGHPVPCDCGAHTEADFPGSTVDTPPSKALIGNFFDIKSGLPSGSVASFGYEIVEPGSYTLGIECWDTSARTKSLTELAVTLKVGVYRLAPVKGEQCHFRMTRPALIVGSNEEPEILLLKADHTLVSQLEVVPGKHTMTVVCRQVLRSKIAEGREEITLKLAPGEIYRVNAHFEAPNYQCRVMASRK